MKMRSMMFGAALLLPLWLCGQGRPGSQNFPPVVNGDGTVTFRVSLPNAKEVRFFGDFGGGGKMPLMQKGDNNLWTHTTTPESPDTYHYSFLADGVLIPDPSNVNWRDQRSYLPWINILDIRGAEPFPHDASPAVPHGTVHATGLNSAVVGRAVPILVYTPPGYEDSQKPYPVIYLIHGTDGTAAQWNSDGRMENLADNLIAGGRMPEAILVSPDGNMPGNSFAAFERYMVEEVIPFVESRFRARTAAEDRTIIGVSRGGNQAFHVAFKHPELFTRLGVFSINLGVLTTQTYAALSDVAKLNQQIRTFVYAGGTEDSLISFASVQAAHDRLTQMGVVHTFTTAPSDHAWHFWRKLFADFVGRM